MNDLQRARIRHAANNEVVRRMLISYFITRGFTESFDRAINPATIQDLPYVNPGLDTKIEIEPHALDIDPTTGRAVMGWNLFVLGNQRMFLGETHHHNLVELARQIKQGQIQQSAITGMRRCTTPRRIITFVERVLNRNDAGYVDVTPRDRPMATRPRAFRAVGGPSGSEFYSRSGYGT